MTALKLLPTAFMLMSSMAFSQSIPLGEEMVLCNCSLGSDTDPQVFQSYMLNEFIPSTSSDPQTAIYLLQSDRGDNSGEFLLTYIAEKGHLSIASLVSDQMINSDNAELATHPSEYLAGVSCTKYQLIGANGFKQLPEVDLLGIHYIKVKQDRSKEFEQLVVEKLHPTVGHLVHDMNLLYFKGVQGEYAGSYITLYAIESVAARERFWPTGGPEQEVVKQLFGQHVELAKELSSYLVENSYLGPESGGGAAYFESLEWTDYLVLPP